jgi:hypothetical protein
VACNDNGTSFNNNAMALSGVRSSWLMLARNCERAATSWFYFLCVTSSILVKRVVNSCLTASVNTEPLPGPLATVTSPPIIRASLRESARPSPVPP